MRDSTWWGGEGKGGGNKEEENERWKEGENKGMKEGMEGMLSGMHPAPPPFLLAEWCQTFTSKVS